VYFGPEAPDGHENNWLQTIPGMPWFSVLRMYGSLEQLKTSHHPHVDRPDARNE